MDGFLLFSYIYIDLEKQKGMKIDEIKTHFDELMEWMNLNRNELILEVESIDSGVELMDLSSLISNALDEMESSQRESFDALNNIREMNRMNERKNIILTKCQEQILKHQNIFNSCDEMTIPQIALSIIQQIDVYINNSFLYFHIFIFSIVVVVCR